MWECNEYHLLELTMVSHSYYYYYYYCNKILLHFILNHHQCITHIIYQVSLLPPPKFSIDSRNIAELMQQKAEINRLIAENQKREAAKAKVGDFSCLTQHLLPVLMARNRIQKSSS